MASVGEGGSNVNIAKVASSTVLLREDDDGEEIDINNVIGGENDLIEVLQLLGEQPNLRLTNEQLRALKDAKLRTFDKAFSHWNTSKEDAEKDDDDFKVTDFDGSPKLKRAWARRPPWVNWTFAIAFHVVVIINFFYCLWDSYSTLVESSKFDSMALDGYYQCVDIPPNQHGLAHFVSIFHAVTCVGILHAKSKKTANLCWAFLLGCTVHACFKFYERVYIIRFVYEDNTAKFTLSGILKLLEIFFIELTAFIVTLLRYYDLTEQFQERAHEFSTQHNEGRQLNDRINYKNVSSFLQRKFVLRSCISLQIYSTVGKILEQKRLHTKLDEAAFEQDVKMAIAVLKEVEVFGGMEMLRELKRRQYKDTDPLLEEGEQSDEKMQQRRESGQTIFSSDDEYDDVLKRKKKQKSYAFSVGGD